MYKFIHIWKRDFGMRNSIYLLYYLDKIIPVCWFDFDRYMSYIYSWYRFIDHIIELNVSCYLFITHKLYPFIKRDIAIIMINIHSSYSLIIIFSLNISINFITTSLSHLKAKEVNNIHFSINSILEIYRTHH
jgi:hypothetical protein